MKNSEARQKIKELGEKLFISGKYVKYQKPVNNIIWFSMLIPAVLMIIFVILMVFLPVFKIELNLLDTTVISKNFSFYDNYKMMIENYGEDSVVIGYNSDLRLLCILCLFFSIEVLLSHFYIAIERLSNTENITIKKCSLMKVGKTNYSTLDLISGLVLAVGIFICGYIVFKNSVFSVSGDIYSEDFWEYIVYYSDDGTHFLTAYKNYFMLCNGVTNTIAIPIIVIILAAISIVVALVINKKLQSNINKEEIFGEI